MSTDAQIGQAAELIAAARRAWVLTGAGISTESGLPDYRGPAGMWRNRRFEELASIEALRDEPAEFWEFYRMRLDVLGSAEPGAAHRAVAALERAGVVQQVATQNVDGLHQAAGSTRVLELHGSLRIARCRSCNAQVDTSELPLRWGLDPDRVPRCDCGAVLGPDVVLFGEMLPPAIDDAFTLAGSSDLAIVLGSSLEVGPVNMLPAATVQAGGRLLIVNLGPTMLDDVADLKIEGRLGEVLPALARELGVPLP